MKPCLSHYRHRPHSRRARRPWLLTAAALPLLATLVIAGSTAKEKRQVQVTKAYLRKEPREMCVPHASLNYADVVELDGTQDPWSQVHAASDPNQQGWLFTEVITKTELFRHQGDVPKGFQPNENGARIADKGLGDPNLVSEFLNANPDVARSDFQAIDEMERLEITTAEALSFRDVEASASGE